MLLNLYDIWFSTMHLILQIKVMNNLHHIWVIEDFSIDIIEMHMQNEIKWNYLAVVQLVWVTTVNEGY